jgi:hypothetical protein
VRNVKRNAERFPGDFMFQLTREEFDALRSQFGISNGRGGRRYRPYAFTEQGVVMLSSVLNSPRTIQVNIEIMLAFVRLRSLSASNEDLARRLDALEQRYDAQFKVVFDAIRQLMEPPEPKRRPLGYPTDGNRMSAEICTMGSARSFAPSNAWCRTTVGAEVDVLTGLPFESASYASDGNGVRLLRRDNVGGSCASQPPGPRFLAALGMTLTWSRQETCWVPTFLWGRLYFGGFKARRGTRR